MRCKVVVTGDYGVGKTCLIFQFVNQTFTDAHVHTIGVDFFRKTIRLDGLNIDGQYWDTSGIERWRPIPGCLYKGFKGCGAVLVYDVTNKASFDNLKLWFEKVVHYAEVPVVSMILGNKCDLADQRVVEFATAKEYADSIGALIIEVCAKTYFNVEQAFVTLVAKLKEHDLLN